MEPGQFHRLGNDGAVSVLDRFLQSQSHCPAVEHGTHREFIETPPSNHDCSKVNMARLLFAEWA